MLRVFVLVTAALAIAATPIPSRTDRMIYDTANVIDDAAERALTPRLKELFQKTGVAVVVLTVPRLEAETISDLAVRAGQTWGVGRAGEDRGVVIALANEDREIFVATGYGTEAYLPDGKVGELIDRHAMPQLRAGQLGAGLVALTDAIAQVSAQEYGVQLRGAPMVAPPRAREGGGIGSLLLLIVGIVAFMFLAWRHPTFAFVLLAGRMFGRGGGFGGGIGSGGFGGGGFGGGGAGRSF